MSLEKLAPEGWATIIREGGHGNLLDQSALASNPAVADWNRQLAAYGHSKPGSEIAFLFDASPMYRCFRVFERVVRAGNRYHVRAMNCPPECDPPLAKMRGLAPRPVTLADFFEWNKRYESDAEAEDDTRRMVEAKEKAERDMASDQADKKIEQFEALGVDMEANPGKYAPSLSTGWTAAAAKAAMEEEPVEEAPSEPEAEADDDPGATAEVVEIEPAQAPSEPSPEPEPEPEPEEGQLLAEDVQARFLAAMDAMSEAKAAEMFGVSGSTINRWKKNGVPAARLAEIDQKLPKE